MEHSWRLSSPWYFRLVGGLIALFFVGLPQPQLAQATNHTVCLSGCSFTTIATALASGLVANNDTLQLTAASYNESNLNITKSLTIIGTGVVSPTIGPAVPGGNPIFKSTTASLTITFQNLVVQNGASFISAQGGGISSSSGSTRLILDQVTVRNNSVSFPTGNAIGGGIYAGGPLTITNSLITGNSSTATGGGPPEGASGGGIHAGGSVLYISNTQILSNTVTGGNATPGF